jgi:hypothetical protein
VGKSRLGNCRLGESRFGDFGETSFCRKVVWGKDLLEAMQVKPVEKHV